MAAKVSIITVNLNNRDGLRKSIESVVTQSFADFEYLIIDGGSTDGSVEVIRAYAGKIYWWVSETDSGIFNAMNKGISQAHGDYCLFLNSGDFLLDQDILSKVFAKDYTEDILYGNSHVSKAGRIVFTSIPPENLTLQSFYNKTIPHQSTFIKKELFERFGFYSENYKIHGDYEFWIRAIILGNCTTRHLDLVVTDYNLEGISSDPANILWSDQEGKDILINSIPARIFADYEAWRLEKEDLRPLFWLKSKPILYQPIRLLFLLASRFNSLKKRLAGLFKNQFPQKRSALSFRVKKQIVQLNIWMKFLYKRKRQKPVLILTYHQIGGATKQGTNSPLDWTSLADFEKTIRFLLKKKYHFVSLQEAVRILESKQERKKHYVAMTFDDGYASILNALPLLEKYAIPTTFFINSANLDDQKNRHADNDSLPKDDAKSLYLKRSQLFAIRQPLFRIGLHGHEHVPYSSMPLAWCRENIEKNIEILKAHPNYIPFFAFPFGALKPEDIPMIESLGLTMFFCDGKLNYGKSLGYSRLASDGEVLSFNLLAKFSGESFSCKRLFNFERDS